MTKRDARIVKRARLYALLADRDEYNRHDRAERFAALDRKIATFVSPVDAESIEDATDLDRVCGAAVRRLRKRSDAGVVDVLGWIDPDRLAAVVLALPEDRRRAITRDDPVWARAWATVDLDAVREVETIISDLDAAVREYDDHLRVLGIDPDELTFIARRVVAGMPGER